MAGIQPCRYPQAASNKAANMGPAIRYSEGSPPDASNMAAGVNLLPTRPEGAPSCPPAANPAHLPYSMVTMEYFCPRLQIGVSEPVMVTQVSDPHRLFCQLRSMSHEIQRLSESMHHYYEVQQQSCGDQAARFSLALGQACASYGEDGRWHRSLLQEFFPEKQQALVVHVDWGKKEVVPANRLRNLASDFFRLPVFTIPCTMYGIFKDEFNWDPVFVSDVRDLLLQRHLIAKIECYNSYEHLYVVDLFGEDGINLNGLVRMRSQIHRSRQTKMPGTTEPPPQSKTKKPQQTPYNPRYPPVELKTDKFEDAVVEFVIDPSSFWVRIEKFAAKHKEMVNGMTRLYSQASKLEGIITEPKPGQICCAHYQDLYYRAEVISVDTKKQVKVFFLDNGMLETVDWYNIRELPAEFSKLPALANRCCLADTYPLENTWSQEAILAFKVAITDKKLVIYVVSKDADEYTIEVMDQSRIQETSVGKILAKAGLAKFEEMDSAHSHASNRKDAHVASAKAALNPTAPDYVLKVQETAAADPYEENTENLLYYPFEEQLFKPGTTIQITVTIINHPGYFWCQDATSKQDLHALMGAIQNHCMSSNCPYSGDSSACLAKSTLYNKWYRAFITEDPVDLSPTSTVKVLYVDYGKQETIPVVDLRAINSEFLQLKAQAFRCSVYNMITPPGDNPFAWDDKATEVFMDFVQKGSKGAEFHCLVYAAAYLENEPINIVDLMTPFSSACNTLVKSGYATLLNHTRLAPSVHLHSYYYSMHGIKNGNDEEIFIRHVNSSLMFYGQLTRSSNAIKQISSSITKFIERSQKRKLPPITGALCLAKSRDQRWYRGLILSREESNKIFFVDFGKTEKVSDKCLLPIPSTESELLLVPMQAIRCSLPDIPNRVPAEIVSWFKDVVLDKALRAQVVSKESDGKLSVELYDGDWQINSAIKSKLGMKVPKVKSGPAALDQPRAYHQDIFPKLPDNTGKQERTSSFSVGKTVKSRESNFDSHSEMSRELEPPRYRRNPTFQNKVENKDYNSQFNNLNSQKNPESVPSVSTNSSSQGRDTKQGGNKTSSQRQTLAIASEPKSQAKLPVETLRDIPIRKVFPGMKERVYISQTNSVFDFCVQVAEDNRLDEISDVLNSKISSLELLGDEDVRVGNVICAYFSDDGLYYRGAVKETTKEGLCVEYIDYGNVSVISGCKNYRLPPKCLSIPIMSIRCSLNKPKNASSSPNLEDLLAEFSKRTSDIPLDCEFLKQDGLKWEVLLKDDLGCINELLNEEPKYVEEANRMVMKMRIAREEETSVQSFTWSLPPPGISVKVYISTADSPDCFWCQLSSADMDSLASHVQEAGEQYVQNDNFISTLKIGSPCNVMFSEDQNWYRAIVTKMETDLVTVRFVDYGNEDSVKRDQIRQLPEPLVNIPPQAFLCCLANFDTKEGSWSSEGKQYFYEKFTEDALELTVCKVQESGWCQIPMVIVTVIHAEVNINEEMKNFWHSVQNMDLEPDDLSPVELMRADQPRTGLAGEDQLLQKDEIDDVYPRHGEEQESETEGFKDAMDLCCEGHDDLDEEILDYASLSDGVPLGRGSGEVNHDMANDISPNPPVPVPRDEGGAEVESDRSSFGAFDPLPDLKSSRLQDGAKQELDVKEDVYVESKGLLATNAIVEITKTAHSKKWMEKAAISEIAVTSDELTACRNTHRSKALKVSIEDLDRIGEATLTITTQEGILMEAIKIADEIIPLRSHVHDKETNIALEKVEGTDAVVAVDICKKSKASMPSEDIAKQDIVDSKVSAELIEIEPKDALNLQEKVIQEDVESYGGMNICDDDMPLALGHAVVLEVEDSLDRVAGTEGEEGPASEDCIEIEEIRAEDFSGHDQTVFGEVSTEYLVTMTSESEGDSTRFDNTDCGEITTKDFEEVTQADEDMVPPEGAINEAYISFEKFKAATVEGPLIDTSKDSLAEEPVSVKDLKLEAAGEVFCVSLSIDLSFHEEPEVTQGFMETVKTEGCQGVKAKISKDLVQNEEDLATTNFVECGVAPTTDFQEVIRDNEEAIKEDLLSFAELEATIVEDSLTGFSQDFVASAREDQKLQDICEEFEAIEDLEREAASFEDFHCGSRSAYDHEEPEFVQEFMESSHRAEDYGRDVPDQHEQPLPADEIDIRQREIEQDVKKQELDLNEAQDIEMPSDDYMETEDLNTIAQLKIEEKPQSNDGFEKAAFSEVTVTSGELKECRNTCEDVESLDEAGEAALSKPTQEGTRIETIETAGEIVPMLIRDVHKMENFMVAVEVDMRNKGAMPSEEITGEDIVDNKVSTERLKIQPEGVLILQDEAIQDVESHDGLNICQDDMLLVLGHVDVAEIEDSLDGVAGTEGPAKEDCVDIEAIHAEDFSGHEEAVSGEVSTEYLVTITREDTRQNEEDSTSFNIPESGEMMTKTYVEVSQSDEDVRFPEGEIKEAGISFEEFESTIVEGSLPDFSQDFGASGGEELISGEDLKLRDIREAFGAREDLEREDASFEDFLGESCSTNNQEEPEFVQELMQSSCHAEDCGREVPHQGKPPLSADTNMKPQETEQEQTLDGISAEDVWEQAAEDLTSERDAKQPDSFSVYRDCPRIIESMESVYDSDHNEPLEKTDSESEERHSPGGSTEDLLLSYFNEPRFYVKENVQPEDIEECNENTLSDSLCQTEDCDTEATDSDDHRAAEFQREAPGSAEAELSPVIASAEEGKK